MSKLLKRIEMPNGDIRLAYDVLPPANEMLQAVQAAGIDPVGWKIQGDSGIELFYPKVEGAAPVKQQARTPTIMLSR
jgi:hypothetical protein